MITDARGEAGLDTGTGIYLHIQSPLSAISGLGAGRRGTCLFYAKDVTGGSPLLIRFFQQGFFKPFNRCGRLGMFSLFRLFLWLPLFIASVAQQPGTAF